MWAPQLEKHGPVYRQVLDALEGDIAGGALAAGARLPPQRQLAFALGIFAALIKSDLKFQIGRAHV